MLSRLYITNYALISELQVDFHKNLNTVTGETGAGKSIILGALGLIIGNRADLSALKEKDRKCIVEGSFEVKNYNLQPFFEENDLDYDPVTILRREITPAGKSRAFINDTPVPLKVLRDLGLKLIDIHSQHQNLELGNQKFQLGLVDAVAGTDRLLAGYKQVYSDWKQTRKELDELVEQAEKEKADLDYFQFQFNQLEEAALKENEQEGLEEELEKLNHAEEIKTAFTSVGVLLDDDRFSVIQNIKEAAKALDKIKGFMHEAGELHQRLQSSVIELRDLADEAANLAEKVEYNPARIEEVTQRLNLLYSLQQKHHVESVRELIALRDELDNKINLVTGYDDEILQKKKSLAGLKDKLEQKASELSAQRIKSFSVIQKSVVEDLKQLGMPKVGFQIGHKTLEEYTSKGKDSVGFLFSANADSPADDISKIASGGEMSRLMLAIKNLLRRSKALPTIIFDEIDSGISGEIALKMGAIIESFASSTQIINITHLPQIAARGNAHFHVYKFEEKGKTYTSVRPLSEEERVEELAKMVGGDKLTETTISAARQMLAN